MQPLTPRGAHDRERGPRGGRRGKSVSFEFFSVSADMRTELSFHALNQSDSTKISERCSGAKRIEK